MPEFEVYEHHGRAVAVRSELKGQHRAHCLCHSCKRFTPDDQATNCNTANLLYAVDVALGLVTPVWECPDFVAKES